MLRLEDLKEDLQVHGLLDGQVVTVIQARQIAPDAFRITYRDGESNLGEQLLDRSAEERIEVATVGRPWGFDAPGKEFRLALEAWRIDQAHLFDPMMAVHTSSVEPLPHQIAAVYQELLPRQPLRYVLADDPGAGKTIMAGLYIRELIMRSDAQRVLIVSPGSLTEQWQDELLEKFGLHFEIFSREKQEASATGNYFEEQPYLICRLDQISRNEDYQKKLKATEWDLTIIDEAHKLSATYYGRKLTPTRRFKLGELLGKISRNFLLMTATPHNGKEEEFQIWLSLLDHDRFFGRFREGADKVDVSDVMRRMVKEELLKFDGTRLFPERRAYTADYDLSDEELELYEEVTRYVREEMNRAEKLAGTKKGAVGFALTLLQRRLASSPEAIYQSLKRRRERLESKLQEKKDEYAGRSPAESVSDISISYTVRRKYDIPEDADEFDDFEEELNADEYEHLADELVDEATAARTVAEFESEIWTLKDLEERARRVATTGKDRKWEELSAILQESPEMKNRDGRRRKLIVFTEHKDTLNYLVERIAGVLGSRDSIVTIHGGVSRDDRRTAQEEFRNNPDVLILIATDAAGEGVNLQNANLMVNYDLPWNPNRLEQRFGRIHRIGQTEVCHLWNLVAHQTREGEVYKRLLEKLKVESDSLGGKVFDILGEAFDNTSLRELLIEAIRYGDDPDRKREMTQKIDASLDHTHLKEIIRRNALSADRMSLEQLQEVRNEMEKAEARKLQPHFIHSFFREAFEHLDGQIRTRETGRFQIPWVPAAIIEKDRSSRSGRTPVVKKYERICFERNAVQMPGRGNAELMHPGHPLMQAMTRLILDRYRTLLRQGSVMVLPDSEKTEPYVLVMIDHAVRETTGAIPRVVSRRLQFVEITPDGNPSPAGWAPHLDLRPISEDERTIVADLLDESWLDDNLESLALSEAARSIAPEHFAEVQQRQEEEIDKVHKAVHDRLSREIHYLSDRFTRLENDPKAGREKSAQLEGMRRTIDELRERLNRRVSELNAMRRLASSPPVVVGGVFVIPQGCIEQRRGNPTLITIDPAARARVERIAMQAVMEAERVLGHEVTDESAKKIGWDVSAQPPARNGQPLPDIRCIEVKGRAKGQTTVTITRNEIMTCLNKGTKFILAIVLVDGDSFEGPYYIRSPFTTEPAPTAISENHDLADLLARAVAPEQTI